MARIAGTLFSAAGLLSASEVVGPPVTIIVEHAASQDAAMIRTAQAEAARILEEAGIPAVWPACGELKGPACRRTGEPDVLRVRLVPENEGRKWKPNRTALGFALRSNGPQHATLAIVFLDRVWAMAKRREMLASLILGSVIAHEIGHLLSTSSDHADDGLMKAEWQVRELALMRQRKLSFSAEQAEAMRQSLYERFADASTGLLARLARDEAKGTGGLAAPPVQ
jgi:hypothetical protein